MRQRRVFQAVHCRMAIHFEFQHAAWDVHRAGQMALGELPGFAHVDQRHALGPKGVELGMINLADACLGGGNKVLDGRHLRVTQAMGWVAAPGFRCASLYLSTV